MSEQDDRADRQREYLQRIETGGSLAVTRYEPRDLPSLMDFSQMVARSQLCPAALQGKPQDVALVLMTGAERGFTAMQSLQNVYVIYGRVSISASLMRALVLQDSMCEEFRPTRLGDDSATIVVRRKDWPEGVREEVTYTVEMAKKAGYYDRKDSRWPKEPGRMCLARATSVAADAYFPAVKSGLMEQTEAEEVAQDSGRPQAISAAAQATAERFAAGAKAAVREKETEPDVVDAEVVEEEEETLPDFARELLQVEHVGEKNAAELLAAGYDSWDAINAATAKELRKKVRGVGDKAALALITEAAKHRAEETADEAESEVEAETEAGDLSEEERAEIEAAEEVEAIEAAQRAEAEATGLPHRPNFRPQGSGHYMGLQALAKRQGATWAQVEAKAREISGGYPPEKLNDPEWNKLQRWLEAAKQEGLFDEAVEASPAARRFEIGEVSGEVVSDARVATLLKYANRDNMGVIGGQTDDQFRSWLRETFGVETTEIPVEIETLLLEWVASTEKEDYEEVLESLVAGGVLKEVE